MRRLLDSAAHWLRHPRLTLASNIQFVVGVGIFAAALVGGALRVLTDFPTVWLVLSAVGAFLTVTGGVGVLAQWKAPAVFSPQDPPDEPVDGRQELRQTIGRLLTELEIARGAIEHAQLAATRVPPLSTTAWDAGADLLSGAGLDSAHRAARIAYRHITELSGTSLSPWVRTDIPLHAIKEAERELEATQATFREERPQ